MHKNEYNTKNLDLIVGDFLDQYNTQTKDIRFNLFIDANINGYLQRASMGNGKTKDEIVREVLLKQMRNEERRLKKASSIPWRYQPIYSPLD